MCAYQHPDRSFQTSEDARRKRLPASCLKASKPLVIVSRSPCSGRPAGLRLRAALVNTLSSATFCLVRTHHISSWSIPNGHNRNTCMSNSVCVEVCSWKRYTQAARWSSSERAGAPTGGLRTGRSGGNAAIIENTTVHSHSATAGAIHSQQSLHHYGERRQGEGWGRLSPPKPGGGRTAAWPCPHPISTERRRKKEKKQHGLRGQFLITSSSNEGEMTTL